MIAVGHVPLVVHALSLQRIDELFITLTKRIVFAAGHPQQLELGVGSSWITENRLAVSVEGGAALKCRPEAKRSRFPSPTLSDCPPPMLSPTIAVRWPALGANTIIERFDKRQCILKQFTAKSIDGLIRVPLVGFREIAVRSGWPSSITTTIGWHDVPQSDCPKSSGPCRALPTSDGCPRIHVATRVTDNFAEGRQASAIARRRVNPQLPLPAKCLRIIGVLGEPFREARSANPTDWAAIRRYAKCSCSVHAAV